MVITSKVDQVTNFLKEIGNSYLKIKDVMIIGGSKVSYYLTKFLTEINVKVKIIEAVHEKCKFLSSALPKALIINGDGSDKHLLIEEGIEKAVNRIRKRLPVTIRQYQDEPTPDGASFAVEKSILDKEGQRILSGISREDYVVALCIEGSFYNSAIWYRRIDRVLDEIAASPGSLTFVIGGSLGLSDTVIKRADKKLSFSSMTFPHQLMRLILLEQLAAWAEN